MTGMNWSLVYLTILLDVLTLLYLIIVEGGLEEGMGSHLGNYLCIGVTSRERKAGQALGGYMTPTVSKDLSITML